MTKPTGTTQDSDLIIYLNKQTGYLINWGRAGSLFATSHTYSNQELLERAFIIVSMGAGGFFAANKRESGAVASFIFGASLAFLLAHTITMSPLIYKRLKAKWDAEKLVSNLKEQHKENSDLLPLIEQVIDKVMNHSEAKSPSAVWGKRLRLLKTLEQWITDTEDHSNLSKTLNSLDIISLLDKNNIPTNEEYSNKMQ